MPHDLAVKNFWAPQSARVDTIRARGVERYVVSLPDVALAFQPADRWPRCIDEGNQHGIL